MLADVLLEGGESKQTGQTEPLVRGVCSASGSRLQLELLYRVSAGPGSLPSCHTHRMDTLTPLASNSGGLNHEEAPPHVLGFSGRLRDRDRTMLNASF